MWILPLKIAHNKNNIHKLNRNVIVGFKGWPNLQQSTDTQKKEDKVKVYLIVK